MKVAQFIVSHLGRGRESGGVASFGIGTFFIVQVFRRLFRNADGVAATVRSLPLDRKRRAGRDAVRSFQLSRARIFHHRRWRCLDLLHGLEKRLAQGTGIVGGEKKTARPVGQTSQASLVFFADIEPDHMHGKVDSALGQFGGNGTRVLVAGLQAVADENNRGALFRISQGMGRLDNRFTEGGHALGTDGLYFLLQGRSVMRAYGNNHFDIVAVALAAMSVDHQAGLKIRWYVIDEIGGHFLGDLNFWFAVDLSPHGT